MELFYIISFHFLVLLFYLAQDTMKKTTESSSLYQNLELMNTNEIIHGINQEDQKVALAVEKQLPAIARLIDAIFPKMEKGGRLFYIGAGTSGRLGVVDASECPPTFGVDFNTVVGLIAGGDGAIRKAVEFAEDDIHQAWKDLQAFDINPLDSVVGIAASGTTPYVIGGLEKANDFGCVTGAITCNEGSPIAQTAQFPVEVVVGPEFVTGSTRMKSGTAQKLVLNMLSTALMIKLGKVKGNKMVDMQLSNEKLVDRACKMVMEATGVSYEHAAQVLDKEGSVRNAIKAIENA